ncbi:MAG: hypothetical protein HOI53_07325 [Francisellaceae bacterium]|jgi:MSHA biogenesis protein MshP|nr:hypothetical protein [Francisellaceae bacterium]MBT6207823.1 hypothetical protein [Francisellaceae bacterium]MBT6538847.1 hypothetical protein [Francisellaceae bacterium]
MRYTGKKQKGMMLFVSIFILVVLALISTYVVSISAMTRHLEQFATQGVRAFFTARSGIEWGLFQVTNNPLVCPPTTTFNLTQGSSNGFSVQISCTVTSYTEGINNFNLFTITSFAERGSFGDADYVSRRLRVVTTLN